MKKLILIPLTVILNVQFSISQTPINIPDNIGTGNCLDFDGNTNAVLINNDAIWNNTFSGPTAQFTLSCWVNFSVSKPNHILLVKTGDSSCNPDVNERQLYLTMDASNKIAFVYFGGLISTSVRIVTGATVLNNNEWYHVGVTYDASINTNDGLDRVKIYVNGIQESTTLTYSSGALPTIASGPAPLAFGMRFNGSNVACEDNDNEFEGQMDEIRIWNSIRTQSQIKNNMCQSLEGNETGLVGYWNMNEGTGGTVTDLTSNGNDGTLQ